MKSLLLLLLFFSANAFAFSGLLRSTTDDYPYHLSQPTSDVTPYVTLELSDKYKFTKAFRFQWKAYGLTNTVSRYQPENYYGDVREAYFEYRASSAFKFRVGMNTVNWGVVDVNSPSDVVNTEALFQPLRIFRQGSPMVQFLIGEEKLNLDLIYIPIQRPPQLPSADSRWLPRKFLLNVPGYAQTIYLPPAIEYVYDPAQTFDHALNNNYGAKIASHQGAWDFQLTYFEGVAPQPKILPTTVHLNFTNTNQLNATSPIELTALNYRQRTTGLGFVWAQDKVIVRGETAYQASITDNSNVQPWNWASVLAAETNVDLGSSSMTILAELFYTKNPQAADNLIASTYRLFDQTGLIGFRWAYSEVLVINASILYTAPTQGEYWMVGFTDKLNDHLSWGLSWNDFSAVQDGLLKTYEDNNHATLDLAYYF